MGLILVSFDVADGKQPQFRQILADLEFRDTVGEGQNAQFLPESTMVTARHSNIVYLEHQITKAANDQKIEIERLVLFGGQPEGISLAGTKLRTIE